MLKIVKIEAIPLEARFEDIYGGINRVPPSLLNPASSYKEYKRHGQCTTIVKITSDDGHTGFGEAYGLPTPKITAIIVNEILAPLLIGKDPLNINALWEVMSIIPNRGGHSKGFIMEAISGVDQALWDLKGKILNVPIHTLIGGKLQSKIDCYASPVMLFDDVEKSKDRAREFVSQGFTALKIKVGRGIGIDCEHVGAVREAVGKDIRILLDVNCAYDVRTAITFAKEVEQYGIYWLEEPVPSENIDGLAEVRKSINMPLATGENDFTVNAFHEFLKKGAADVIMPNLARAGGISGAVRINEVARAYSVQVSPHGVGSGINIAAAIQFMTSYENTKIFEYNQLLNPLRHDIIKDFLEFKDGCLTASDGPGLGIELNDDVISKYRVEL